MGDRRMGDRREPEKGIIKVKFKDAIIYLVLALFLIISIAANIVLIIRCKEYKERYEQALEEYAASYEDLIEAYNLNED